MKEKKGDIKSDSASLELRMSENLNVAIAKKKREDLYQFLSSESLNERIAEELDLLKFNPRHGNNFHVMLTAPAFFVPNAWSCVRIVHRLDGEEHEFIYPLPQLMEDSYYPPDFPYPRYVGAVHVGEDGTQLLSHYTVSQNGHTRWRSLLLESVLRIEFLSENKDFSPFLDVDGNWQEWPDRIQWHLLNYGFQRIELGFETKFEVFAPSSIACKECHWDEIRTLVFRDHRFNDSENRGTFLHTWSCPAGLREMSPVETIVCLARYRHEGELDDFAIDMLLGGDIIDLPPELRDDDSTFIPAKVYTGNEILSFFSRSARKTLTIPKFYSLIYALMNRIS